jgi:hypothetical protein
MQSLEQAGEHEQESANKSILVQTTAVRGAKRLTDANDGVAAPASPELGFIVHPTARL